MRKKEETKEKWSCEHIEKGGDCCFVLFISLEHDNNSNNNNIEFEEVRHNELYCLYRSPYHYG